MTIGQVYISAATLAFRLKVMCCREWGISPREFEEQAARRDFTYAHVSEMLRQLGAEGRRGAVYAIYGELIEEMQMIEKSNAALDRMWAAVRAKAAEQQQRNQEAAGVQ